MNSGSEGKRGRPSLGNVVFKRRVSPEMARQLEAVISGTVPGVMTDVERMNYEKQIEAFKGERRPGVGQLPVAQNDSSQVKALLDDNERLTQEVAHWKKRFEDAVDAFPDKQAQYWRVMFQKLMKFCTDKFGPFDFAQ